MGDRGSRQKLSAQKTLSTGTDDDDCRHGSAHQLQSKLMALTCKVPWHTWLLQQHLETRPGDR